MSLFSPTSCLAVTWDSQGRCRALVGSRHGAGVRITGVWQGEVRGKRALAQLVQEAIRELGATADTAVIIGGNAEAAGIFDVRLPKMSAEDLHGAIEFRLGAQIPTAIEDVFWGYRITDRSADQLTARVAYVRRDAWDQWIEAAGGSSVGVDAVMPPQAALDPVFGGRAVCLDQGGDDDLCFMLEPQETGQRSVRLARFGAATAAAFGARGDAPLADDQLELGPLAEKSAAEQVGFAGCAALVCYGVSDGLSDDRGHWPALPQELRPRRNRILKYWTAGVAIYLIFVLTLLTTSHFHRNYVRLQRVEKDTKRLEALVATVQKQVMREDRGVTLSEELDLSGPQRISMVKTMAHLSALTNENLWVTNFNWDYNNRYKVRLELRGEQDHEDLIQSLRQTPLLEALEVKKNLNPGGQVSYVLDGDVINPDELPALPAMPKLAEPAADVDDDAAPDDTLPDDGGDANDVDENDLVPPPPPPLPNFPGANP